MKFNLLDTIDHLDDQKIVATKSVSLAEEYLADHFPSFPVLPGVMMLEALTQASSWLLMHRTGFAKSIAVLKEAKQVRYGQFVAPGQRLRVEVELVKTTDTGAQFKAAGTVTADGTTSESALSAKLELAYFNLADTDPSLVDLDARLIAHTRTRWQTLRPYDKLPAAI